jgi:hypothetical protein
MRPELWVFYKASKEARTPLDACARSYGIDAEEYRKHLEVRATSTALRRQRGLPPRHLAVVRPADESAESSGMLSPVRGFSTSTLLKSLLSLGMWRLIARAVERSRRE